MVWLGNLPVDLIWHLGSFLTYSSLNSLLKASKQYAELLTPLLYNTALEKHSESGEPLDQNIFRPPEKLWSCLYYWESTFVQQYILSKPRRWASKFIFYQERDYYRSYDIESFLQKVVRAGNLLIINLLLANAKVDLTLPLGKESLLFIASCRRRVDIFEALLNAGADTAGRLYDDGYEESLLLTTTRLCLLEAVLLLIEHLNARGIPLHTRGAWGHTPLHAAVEQGNLSLVRILIDNGADVYSRAELLQVADITAFHMCLLTGDKGYLSREEICLELVEHMRKDMARLNNERHQISGENAFQTSIRYGKHCNWSIARRLIDIGVSLDIEDPQGLNLMEYTMKFAAEPLLEVLTGLSPDKTDRIADIDRIIQTCNVSSEDDLVRLRMLSQLQDMGRIIVNPAIAFKPCQSQIGYGPLYVTVGKHREEGRAAVEFTRWLLKLGASPESQYAPNLTTPLHVAIRGVRGVFTKSVVDIVTLLIDASTNVSIVDSSGNTPLHYASSNCFFLAAKLLLAKMETRSILIRNNRNQMALHEVAARPITEHSAALLRLFLPWGPTVLDCRSGMVSGGRTAVHFLASRDNSRLLLQEFKEAGADLSALNAAGEPPVHAAVVSGRSENVQFFVEAKADLHEGCEICWEAGERLTRASKLDVADATTCNQEEEPELGDLFNYLDF